MGLVGCQTFLEIMSPELITEKSLINGTACPKKKKKKKSSVLLYDQYFVLMKNWKK